jgi:hypothetical protein
MDLSLYISPWVVTALAVIHLIAQIITIVVILLETHSPAKAMAYILVVIVFPVLGTNKSAGSFMIRRFC